MEKYTYHGEKFSFDGFGINGADEYKTRLATFTSPERAEKYGKLLAAAPELLEALERLVSLCESGEAIGSYFKHGSDLSTQVYAAIKHSKG